jgi:hypothetical protein
MNVATARTFSLLTVGQDSVVIVQMMGDWRPKEAYLEYQRRLLGGWRCVSSLETYQRKMRAIEAFETAEVGVA